jgi:hypothetical protein
VHQAILVVQVIIRERQTIAAQVQTIALKAIIVFRVRLVPLTTLVFTTLVVTGLVIMVTLA